MNRCAIPMKQRAVISGILTSSGPVSLTVRSQLLGATHNPAGQDRGPFRVSCTPPPSIPRLKRQRKMRLVSEPRRALPIGRPPVPGGVLNPSASAPRRDPLPIGGQRQASTSSGHPRSIAVIPDSRLHGWMPFSESVEHPNVVAELPLPIGRIPVVIDFLIRAVGELNLSGPVDVEVRVPPC